jgi:hypothetical protein
MREIHIATIPIEKMRYPTLGDYRIYQNSIHIDVADTGNPDYDFLIALHELVECYLTIKRGIPEPTISAFDIEFEKNERDGEPGDAPDSPYYAEHQVAGIVERILCGELGIRWCDYDTACEGMFEGNNLWMAQPAYIT